MRRNRVTGHDYSAHVAQQQMQVRRRSCRPKRKLSPDGERFGLVTHLLRIAGKLRNMKIPSLRDAYV